MNNFAIRCAHTHVVDPSTLKPHPRNPNRHPPQQIEAYVAIIRYQGWRRAITVSGRSGFVTKGHGALEAALSAGQTEVPIDWQDYPDDASELADIVADNELGKLSQMDTGKLLEIANDLRRVDGFDISLTALSESGIRALSWETDLGPSKESVGGVAPHTEPIPGKITVHAPSPATADALRPRLKEFIASLGAAFDGVTVA